MSKKIGLVVGLSLACLLVVGAPAQANGIKVMINGAEKQFEPGPVEKDGRTLVPMRAFFQSLGATVDWDEQTMSVTGKKGDLQVKLTIGSGTAYVNGVAQSLDVKAQLLGEYTYIPLRFVGTSLGAKVDYSASNKTITISAQQPTSGTTPSAQPPRAESGPSEFPELNLNETQLSSFSTEKRNMLVSYLNQIDTLARLPQKEGFEYSTLSYLYRSAGNVLATSSATKADAQIALNNSLAAAEKYLAVAKISDYTPYLTAAEAAKAVGKDDLAAGYYVKALALQDDADLRLQLAKLYLKLGKSSEAQPELDKVIATDKGFAVGTITLPNLSRVEAVYLKANLLYTDGDKEGAKACYTEFLQLVKQWEDSGFPIMLLDGDNNQVEAYKKLANSRI